MALLRVSSCKMVGEPTPNLQTTNTRTKFRPNLMQPKAQAPPGPGPGRFHRGPHRQVFTGRGPGRRPAPRDGVPVRPGQRANRSARLSATCLVLSLQPCLTFWPSSSRGSGRWFSFDPLLTPSRGRSKHIFALSLSRSLRWPVFDMFEPLLLKWGACQSAFCPTAKGTKANKLRLAPCRSNSGNQQTASPGNRKWNVAWLIFTSCRKQNKKPQGCLSRLTCPIYEAALRITESWIPQATTCEMEGQNVPGTCLKMPGQYLQLPQRTEESTPQKR